MVNSSLGRRWSLAGSTFITAFFCVVFVMVDSTWAVRATTVGISLSATVRVAGASFHGVVIDTALILRRCGRSCTGGHPRYLGQRVSLVGDDVGSVADTQSLLSS